MHRSTTVPDRARQDEHAMPRLRASVGERVTLRTARRDGPVDDFGRRASRSAFWIVSRVSQPFVCDAHHTRGDPVMRDLREINTIVENDNDPLSNQDESLDPDNGNPND
jgi:hypothetical protein